MTSCSTSLSRGRCLPSAFLFAVALLTFGFALVGPIVPSASAADSSPAVGSVNIGTADDPYFVDDPAQFEAMQASAIAQSSMAAAINVVRLNNWTTGLTHTTTMGANRLLIFIVAYENATDVPVNAVTYGGRSLVRIGGTVTASGTRERVEIWYLNEANIVLAGSSTFVVTWGGSTPTSPKYGAATFGNVDQASPVVDHSGNSTTTSSPNPLTTAVTTVAGGMTVSGIMNGNTGSFTWNNSFIEGFDQSGSSSNLSGADHAEAIAGTTTASATHTSATARAIKAASLRPAASAGTLDSINIGQIDPSLFPQICVYVDALDAGGNPVGGLTADSFCVKQDNTQLNVFSVTQLSLDSCRTATCLVIDVSGSMSDGGKMTAAKNAAARYVRNMDTFDRAAIVKFSSCYTVVQNFTGDTTLLLNAINGLSANGTTAYFDGVWAGVGLTIPELGSKAVVNLTDGLENASSGCGGGSTPDGLGDGFSDDSTLIVNLALGAGIPIYSITLGTGFDPQYAQKLAYATGGAYYQAPTGDQLDGIYEQIKERLCTRYKICYTSPDTIQNGDCHNVIICDQTPAHACINCDTAQYCEKAPPKIVRTPATIALSSNCSRWNTQVQLCAWVTDQDTPLNTLVVNMFYRTGNVGPYTSVATTRTDSTFCANVPASALPCGADSIQYYFTASDGFVTVASPSNAPSGHHSFPICVNNPPVCSVRNDTTITQCTPTQVCLPVSATDPNGNLLGCTKTSGPGTYSGGQWCYTPAGSGTVSVTIRCTDSCGLFCDRTFNVTFAVNAAPVCNTISDTTYFQCAPAQVCRPVGATDANGNLTGCAVISGPGTVSGGNWCYTPTTSGTVAVTIRCTDACGAFCDRSFNVTFVMNSAPVCNTINDTSYFQCAPTQVCRPVGATDANGNLTGCAVLSGPGTISGGNWCYTPTTSGTVAVTIRCTDACGAFCDKTFNVTFTINSAPVCNNISDTTYFQCAPTQVCRPVGATDVNGNLTGCTLISGPGTVSGGNWCYTPTTSGTVAVTIRCTDACGAVCNKTFNVTFTINSAPVCNTINDTTYFQCAPTQVCRPVGATDANGNLTGCAIISGPGTLSGGNWCYTPTASGTVAVTIRCTDACGAFCDKTFNVTFTINSAPVCNTINDTTYFQCAPTQVCRPVGATDANGNLTGCALLSGPGTVSGGNWCYTPTTSGTVAVTIRCTDACGAFCDKTFNVTFTINSAPVCNTINDTTYFQCTPTQVCRPVGATDANGNLTGCTLISGPGTVSGGNWCYTPTTSGTVAVTIRCTDACGAFCNKTFNVTFTINSAPVCNTISDTTYFQCAPTQVCRPVGATDANGNLTGCAVVSGPGTVSGGNWCYTPTTSGTVAVTIRCTDACGAFCDKTFNVTFTINSAPVCNTINDTSYFQCAPTQVCRPVGATDANGNLTGCTVLSGPGTISGGNWCYTPTTSGTVAVTIRCTDACGAFCDKTFNVTFTINSAPVCNAIGDTSYFQCTPTQVCRPVGATDANGNLTGCAVLSGPGTISGGNWCYTPTTSGTVAVTIRCTDACGAFCDKTFNVTFTINSAPVCSNISDTTYFQCAPAQVCRPFSATDVNGNLTGCAIMSGPGTLSGGNWCYTPTTSGTVSVTLRCTDACGAFCSKTFNATFVINSAPVCNAISDTTYFQCVPAQVCRPVGSVDPDGNLVGCTVVSGPGTVSGGNWCYTPTGDEVVNVTIRCTDACGIYCEETFSATFEINDPPVIDLGNDISLPQNFGSDTVCFNYTVSDPNGLSGLLEALVSAPAGTTINTSTNEICVPYSTTSPLEVVAKVTDPCGVIDYDTLYILLFSTQPPVCNLPSDTSILQCTPAQVCLPYTSTSMFPPVNCVITSGPGSLSGGNWCYTPSGDGAVTVTITCTDALGAQCNGTFTVTFDINDAPVCTPISDTSYFQCTPTQVCRPITSIDPNGNLSGCTIVSGPGTLSSGNWCYTPSGDQTVNVTIRCTDACGLYCEESFAVTFDINSAPVCNDINDTTIFQCTPTSVCLPFVSNDADGNLDSCAIISGPGTLNGNWCYTPSGDGTVNVTIQCVDSCGATCQQSFSVTFIINDAPVCSVVNDTTVTQCTPAQVCIPVSATDPNGNLVGCTKIAGPGTLSGGQWCYTPSASGTVSVTIRCTDACGLFCDRTFNVTFAINSAPVCNTINDTSYFLCAPTQVCRPIGATDPDGNLIGCTIISGPGTLSGGDWCYTPSGNGTVTVTTRCTDACGATCEETFQVTFTINSAPVCSAINDTSYFQCTPTQVCRPFSATDVNANLTGCTIISGPGTLSGGNWCYTPTASGTVSVTIRCTDACGATCEKSFNVTFTINSAPVCSAINDTSYFQCAATQVCRPVSSTDADGNLVGCEVIAGSGSVSGGNWCFTPAASGTYSVTIRCTDACGAYCDESFDVTFNIGNPPQITCAANQQFACATLVPPCSPSDVTVTGGAGTVTVTCSSSNNGGAGCPASPLIYTYSYTATDSCGATAQCSRTVTVIDNIAPVLAGCPANVTISCSDPVPPAPTVTATDNCDQSVIPVLVETPNLNGCGGYSGTITRVWTATDDCGNASTCTQLITVQDTQAPVCNIPAGPFNYFQCTPTQISIPVSATDNCDATPTCAVIVGPGSVVGGNWVYTPVGDASFSVTIRCSDDCNNGCQSSFNVNVQVNDAPDIAFGPDQSVFQCVPAQICVNYTTTDPNGLTAAVEALVSGPPGATLNAGANQVCFTPAGAGVFTIVASLTDSCGAVDRDTINVTVTLNTVPTISFGNDRSVFQCNAEQICVDYTTVDAIGNALTETLISGPSGAVLDQALNRVCFTPAAAGTFTIIARVQDTCGATDYDTVSVTVTRNLAPTAIPPSDTTVSQCGNAQICLPVAGIDPEGRPLTITKISGPGTIANGQWCFNANNDQVLTITFRVTDSCGAFDDASFTVTFDLNDPPQCQVPADMTVHQNCVPQQVSIPVGAIDPDGNLVSCVKISGPGNLINGNWVYTPFGDGQVCVTIRCTDACGETCERSFCVYFQIDENLCNCELIVSIGDGDGTIQILNGQQVTVPVNIDSVAGPIGGFDFLICYDQSVLTFLHAASAEAIEDWEYFTYRYGPYGNCSGACPSGFVRLVGIANLNNGVQPPESAYYPIGSVAELVFQVSPDRNLINQCVAINFCWLDCGDNTMSSRSGDTTWVDHLMIVDTCQSNAKLNPIPGICFSTGYVCIIEPPDDRGDINLNGIANEVGDAVLFTNYFIYGSTVWDPAWTEVQILATDINDDGIVLTVADLIYLIRIITGDEQPFPPGTGTGSPKLSPYMNSGSAIVHVGDDNVTVSTSSGVELGGALLVFRYTGLSVGEPTLLAGGEGMTVRSHADAGELRVLIHPSWDGDWATIGAGQNEILTVPTSGNGSIELLEVQLSDARGALLSTSAAKAVIPTEYSLMQNYPNPFNAGTVIEFNLKDAAEWDVSIYNVLGQVVRTFEGIDEASSVRVSWDGRDRDGEAVASGVYFYRVTTPKWNATRKMTLLR